MSYISHIDAPDMDKATTRLYNMVCHQEPKSKVIDGLINEFDAASKIMSAPAYIQPNGFWTFKLGGVDGHQVLRLHVWPEGLPEKGLSAGIHDHVFDFTSLLLAGDAPLINTHYNISEDENSPLSLYKVDYKNPKKSNIIKLPGHFRASAAQRISIEPGEYYTFPAGAFHTSQMLNDAFGMTLLASNINPSVSSPRFLAENYEINAPYERQNATLRQREFVSRKLKALKA